MTYQRAVFNRYLKRDEEKQLLSYVGQFGDIQARRDHAWMRALRHLGIRIGSMVAVTVDDARDAVAHQRLQVHSKFAKNGRGYTVPVNRDARAALRDLLKIRREQGQSAIGAEALVMSRKGQGLAVRSYQARMRKWVRAAGLDVEATPHWFRHTLAKRVMAQSTADDPRGIVAGALGHADLRSTAVYTMPDREDVARGLEEAR
jgi:site-specific recombinase XerC